MAKKISKKKKSNRKKSARVKKTKNENSAPKNKSSLKSLKNKIELKKIKEQIRDLIVEGRKFFDSGDYEKSLPLLKKVSEIDNSMPDVLNMMGLIYHYQGKFNLALQAFEEALSINPHYTEASLNLAVTCNDLGRFQEARFVYSRAKKTAKPGGSLDPYVKGRLANMHADVADVYHALGRHVEASEEYRKALQLRPKFVDIQTKMGIALRESGRMDEAVEILQSACKNEPAYLPAAINLGLTYFSTGKTKDAVRIWNGVLQKDPQNEKAKMYLRLVKTS